MPGDDIGQRKSDHLEVAASGRAAFTKTTLLEHVHLVHQALPELSLPEINLGTDFIGKRLAAPLLITGMTGGTPEAGQINRELARAAEAAGIAFGVGSQRAMDEHPERVDTYQVRDVAPNVVLLGNIGGVQALALGPERVLELAKRIGADALAVHLNPGQELIQPHGDRDFRGVRDAIAKIVAASHVPVIVKETGCGLSPQIARDLAELGVAAVDVAGAGGTSWVAVEAVRASTSNVDAAAALGNELWDWGIPTAVSVVACAKAGLTTIASGGMRTGSDVARAIALGARLGGMAAPMLRAQREGGELAIRNAITRVVDSLRATCLLAGCRRASDLSSAPRHLGAPLREYLSDVGLR